MMNKELKLVISRKYAKAFVNVYSDSLDFKQISNLEKYISYLKDHKKAFFYTELVLISSDKKQEIFYETLKNFGLNEIFRNIIDVLIGDKRLFLLIEILEFIVQFYKSKLNIMDFVISSSHELTESEINSVLKFLKTKTKKVINFKLKIDKTLIAGLKIYSRELGWEHSVYNRILSLCELN